jgi:DNA-binding SARP family transcriptional activator
MLDPGILAGVPCSSHVAPDIRALERSVGEAVSAAAEQIRCLAAALETYGAELQEEARAGGHDATRDRPGRQGPETLRRSVDMLRPPGVAAAPAPPRDPVTDLIGPHPDLAVHCLGRLEVLRAGVRSGSWCSRRSKSVFKYLVVNRGRPVQKELLMGLFWPDATADAARNNLHVAVHKLRRTIRGRNQQTPIVFFRDDAYTLDPELDVWVDVEEFERLVASARRLARGGDTQSSIRSYQAAHALYQGDLFEDDPYEDWMLSRRGWLRDAFLGLLGELASYHLARGEYAGCATLCRQVISEEPYREDAHRDLMRCYARQDQPYLALRQYRQCTQSLRIAFGGEPSRGTTDLCQQILRHEPV